MNYCTHVLESMSNIVQGGGDFVCFIDFCTRLSEKALNTNISP